MYALSGKNDYFNTVQHLCFLVNYCGIFEVLDYFSASLYYLSFSLLTKYYMDFQLCFLLTIV